jgi:hypothetical protein
MNRFRRAIERACSKAVITSSSFRTSPDPTDVNGVLILEFRPYYSNASFISLEDAQNLSPQKRLDMCVAVSAGASSTQELLLATTELLMKEARYQY